MPSFKAAGLRAAVIVAAVAIFSPAVRADNGPLGIDHRWTYDGSGVWSRSAQNALIYGLMGWDVVGALWEGGDSRLGKTYWYSIDAAILGGVSSAVLKRAFGRERPTHTNDPDQWFKGAGNQSFPSGEVTTIASIVTPFVLEYGHDHPAVYALELLPAYDAVARLKSRAHWQSDVIAGFVLGTAAGYFAYRRHTPFSLSVLPDGFAVGIKHDF